MFTKEELSNFLYDSQGFAEYFSSKYYETHTKVFPLNPFQILTDLNIHFVFRNFDGLEGLLMPATEESDANLVIINAKRPITRQRFTAAHELCHFLKDSKLNPFICLSNSVDRIEKYADRFASALLMPKDELKRQIDSRISVEGQLTLDDVLIIAEYFGTSFQACSYRISNLFPHVLSAVTKKAREKFKPNKKRAELGLDDTRLLADMMNAWKDSCYQHNPEFAKQVYKNNYIYNDARIEGVDVNLEATAEIVEDLQCNRNLSVYCNEEYENFCHIAGHSLMYDYVFQFDSATKIDVYKLFPLNQRLFSCFPNPDYGGRSRTENVLVLGARFDTVDYRDVMTELSRLNESIEWLEKNYTRISLSEIILEIVKIHHRITVIHPFADGNGRTSRAFMNLMFLRYGVPPVYIRTTNKQEYCNALEYADKTQNYSKLYEFFLKSIIRAHVELAEQP